MPSIAIVSRPVKRLSFALTTCPSTRHSQDLFSMTPAQELIVAANGLSAQPPTGHTLCFLRTPSTTQSSMFARSGSSWRTPMHHLLYPLLATAGSSLKPQRELAPQTLASRQQLAIVCRATSHRATHPSVEGWNRSVSEARLDASSLHEWAALIALEKVWEKPSSLMAVTPTTRSWNHIVGFLTDWEGLRRLAA